MTFTSIRQDYAWVLEALTGEVRLHNLHASGKQYEERNAGVTGPEQDPFRLNPTLLAAMTDPIDLSRRQIWERLRASIKRAGYGPGRHVSTLGTHGE